MHAKSRQTPAAIDAAERAYLKNEFRKNLNRLGWSEIGGAVTECLLIAAVAVLGTWGIGRLIVGALEAVTFAVAR